MFGEKANVAELQLYTSLANGKLCDDNTIVLRNKDFSFQHKSNIVFHVIQLIRFELID